MPHEFQLYDGTKSIPLNQLPPEAWTVIRGDKDSPEAKLRDEVGWLKRCTLLRAEALASLPWTIKKDGKQILSSEDAVVPDELLWLDNFVDLLWLTELSLICKSQAFWMVNRNTSIFDMNQYVSSLQWLAARTMTPKWHEDQGLIAFKRVLGQKEMTLYPEDVAYFWIQDPEHETQPDRPIIEACVSSAKVLKYVDEFAQGFFKRGAIKATILTVDKSAPKTERDRIRTWWTQIMTGISNSWKTQVVSSAVEPVTIGDGIRELNNKELTMERRQDIATTLGVPHSLVFSNSANFATADVDRRNFYVNTIIPSSRIIGKQANRQLFQPLGYSLAFQPERMSIFQADEQNRSVSFLNYIKSGMRPSIAAQILGISLPGNYTFDQLDADFNMVQMEATDAMDKAQGNGLDISKQEEVARFKRWATKRIGTDELSADRFASTILGTEEKIKLIEEIAK